MCDHLRNMTIGELLAHNAKSRPDDEALVFPAMDDSGREVRYTWAGLNEEVDLLARGFLALGIKTGDRVAIWATNRPQWLTVMYAAAKIGAVLVTVNTHYRRTEIEYLLKQSEADYLFLMESFRGYSYLETIRAILPGLNAADPAVSLDCPELPHLKKVILLGEERPAGLIPYDDVLKMAGGTDPATLREISASLRPDDVTNMQYTSGTTGFPKGVMLTHQNIVTNGYWIGRHQGLTWRDRICLPVPLFHCFGLVLGTMAALNHGSAMVVLDVNRPCDILVNIEREKCTAIYGVPTVFISLLNQKAFDRFDLSSLRTGIMAGSPCPVKTMAEVIERMHARDITICYGLTETSPVVAQTTADDTLAQRTETVGRPMPGVEIKIVDSDDGRELPQGATGEVVVRGYATMRGYYNQPEATAAIMDAEGWLSTGDLGCFDENGYLIITGRSKDMIIRAGENIYPQEVEEYLRHMPGVVDIQVVGVPSCLHGEEVGAFLAVSPGFEYIGVKEVKAYLRNRISNYKIPRHVKVLESFPLTANGKVQKYRLRKMAEELWPPK